MEQFKKTCESWEIALSDRQLEQFQDYYELLTEWNTFVNLTAITEYRDVLTKHFLDSLSVVKAIDLNGVQTLLDVGTGAGFPGLPLKIAFPHLKVVLLDSLAKRIRFLDHAADRLGLADVTTLHGRAEEFAQKEEYREQFDLVVSRAVANLSSLSEYCIPYTKVGGCFISYKSGAIEEELKRAEHAIALLGAKQETVCRFHLGEAGARSLVVLRKTKETPKKYPRKAGTPSREPL